jgi:hypothetical protein
VFGRYPMCRIHRYAAKGPVIENDDGIERARLRERDTATRALSTLLRRDAR